MSLGDTSAGRPCRSRLHHHWSGRTWLCHFCQRMWEVKAKVLARLGNIYVRARAGAWCEDIWASTKQDAWDYRVHKDAGLRQTSAPHLVNVLVLYLFEIQPRFPYHLNWQGLCVDKERVMIRYLTDGKAITKGKRSCYLCDCLRIFPCGWRDVLEVASFGQVE